MNSVSELDQDMQVLSGNAGPAPAAEINAVRLELHSLVHLRLQWYSSDFSRPTRNYSIKEQTTQVQGLSRDSGRKL